MMIRKLFRLFITILKANFSSPFLPFKIFLVITKSCGSRCTNCLIWKEIPENELTLLEFEKIAKKMNKHLFWLNLSGGEPTDRQDITEIIDIFVKNCPNLSIINFTSNGLNYDQLKITLDYLKRSSIPIIGINISIDGPPKIHNTIRGTPDGFNDAIKAMKLVRSYPNIKSAAAMTLFHNNFKLISETIHAIQNEIPGFKKHDLHINYPHSSSHYYGNNINYEGKVDINMIADQFSNKNSLFSIFDFVESIYKKNLFKFIKTHKTPIDCAALVSNVYISEKGDVFPCTIWDKKIGSLRNSNYDLKEIISTNLAMSTKQDIKNKNCPNCWTPCEAFPSIITNLKSIV